MKLNYIHPNDPPKFVSKTKDIKLKPGISNNDLAHKMANVDRLLKKGHCVRLSVVIKSAAQKRLLDPNSIESNLINHINYYLKRQINIQKLSRTVDCPVRLLLKEK